MEIKLEKILPADTIHIGGLDVRTLEAARPKPHGMLRVEGLDHQLHDFTCGFVQDQGILPCSCRPYQGKGSEWFLAWKRWSAVRINPGWWARHREEPEWPIQVTPYSCWITGWDD